jgi:hypothetical protein
LPGFFGLAGLFDRQALATRRSPPRQHLLAVLGFHASPETMDFDMAALLWLICAFGHVFGLINGKILA